MVTHGIFGWCALAVVLYCTVGILFSMYWVLFRYIRILWRVDYTHIPVWYPAAQYLFVWLTWPRIFKGKLGFRYGDLEL